MRTRAVVEHPGAWRRRDWESRQCKPTPPPRRDVLRNFDWSTVLQWHPARRSPETRITCDQLHGQLAEFVADRVAARLAAAGASARTSGSTRAAPPSTSASAATTCAGSRPEDPSRPSRRASGASCSSAARTWTSGAALRLDRSSRCGAGAMLIRHRLPVVYASSAGSIGATGVLEVGYKDGIGRLRWRTVDGAFSPA
jgi:hypothetical protein